ncbi:MAG: CHAD domain-containing protein [Terracidiphilus sp.]
MHGLRVATLRLQARMDHWLQGQGAGGPEERAVKRWNRQAEKLRRALSTVRETDVYLGKIEGLRSSVSEPAHGSSRLTRMCLRQIDAVEDRMKRDRKEAARKAVDEIKRRMGRFERLSSELEAELRDAVDGRANSEAGGVGEMIAALLTESSNLNAENLHEFRKRVKNVRYVAEIAGTGSARATRQLAALRRMQSAAGVWHDWQTLAKRASRTLRGRNKEGGLGELLETLAGESLQKALEVCRRTSGRLAKERAGTETSLKTNPPKRPVRSEEPIAALDVKRTA